MSDEVIDFSKFQKKKKPNFQDVEEENSEDNEKPKQEKKESKKKSPSPEKEDQKKKKKKEKKVEIEEKNVLKKPKKENKEEKEEEDVQRKSMKNILKKEELEDKKVKDKKKNTKQEKSEDDDENDKQNDDDPMDLYSKYYDKETGEITKSFREVINSIEDEIKKEMIKKLKSQKNQKSSNKKEFTSILNPWENIKMFSKINSQWRQLFKQHDLFQEIEQIDSLTKSVQFISENPPKPPFDKPPQPILGFFRNKKLDDEENEFFQKMTDKLVVIRYYNQKLEDSNSFYRAVGFAYLEQLVSEDNPFQSLHKFITSLKSKGTFEMMNPISPNTSFNPNFSLDFKSWSTYIIDLLMRMAGNMWTCVEVSEKDPEKMIEELQVLFNENSAFQLGIVLLLRQEGFEKAKQFENYEDCKKNLSEIDAPPTRRVFKTIAKVLKVRLQIFDFDNPSEEPFDFEPTKIDSNLNPIFLVKYKKVYNIGYSKKFSRSRFPKAYQLNSERKQNLCCSCNINEGKKYNKCQDNYCIECLNKILNEMKDVQMAKCPKCRQVLGNRGHLLTESQIKINKN